MISTRYAGANWIRESLKKPLSPLGEKVADILGWTFRGIYHIADAVSKVDWSNERFISIEGHGGYLGCLGTWDGCELTDLLILCHDACIRLEISPCLIPWKDEDENGEPNDVKQAVENLGYDADEIVGTPGLNLLFHQRVREGGMMQRHPTLEDQMKRVRGE